LIAVYPWLLSGKIPEIAHFPVEDSINCIINPLYGQRHADRYDKLGKRMGTYFESSPDVTAVEPEKIKPVVISGRKIQLNNSESDTVKITCKMQ